MIVAFALALAPLSAGLEVRLGCAFQADPLKVNANLKMIDIVLGGDSGAALRNVRFEGESELFADNYGGKSAGSRRWKIKLIGFDGERGFIDITSYVARPGHSARVWLSSEDAGVFKGRYWVNRGMLSESFAEGEDGEVTCRIARDRAGQGNSK